ncbi:MAG: molybdopterin-binding protein [Acidobacteria bacterium]|nr:molybdopterin-binding protein [Acidobacteriota bacterium]MBI3278496.1 molybdopterin-binding protein [Acidobacteriota bacterium]
MKAQPIDVRFSLGRILCCTIFKPGGKKLLSKGHLLSEEDVRLLETEGMNQVWVTQLEDGEVGEDNAVLQVASDMGCGALETKLSAGGRANLFATEDCCLLIDEDLLRQINCTAQVVIATGLNYSYAKAGQRIATVKSAPFAVAQSQLEAVSSIIRERGPLLQARPVRKPAVAVLYSDAVSGDRAKQLFENIMRQRLENFSTAAAFSLSCVEEPQQMKRTLQHLFKMKPTLVLVATTTAPSGPEDVIGRALDELGCHLERFLVPVEPGNLLMMHYKDEVPVVTAPGCYRSAKPNVLDLILPPLLARYRISGWELASLGHGGLLG